MGEEKLGLEIIWTQKTNRQFNDVLAYWIESNKSNTYSLKLIDEVDDKLKFIASIGFSSNQLSRYKKMRYGKLQYNLQTF